MQRLTVLATALLLAFGCDNTSHGLDGGDDAGVRTDGGGGDTDAGSTDTDGGGGDTDAGSTDTDAGGGGSDAGAGMCGSGPPMPAPFDCTTEDPTLTFGAPMTAPTTTWTWVDFPGSRCMDGSATGIGINLNPASTQVMIFLEGGGACFDPISCVGAANPNGYDAMDLAGISGSALSRGVFDRADTANPFRDWNMIYVPYCTGDVHSGSNPMGPNMRQHLGHQNMREYLARIVPTFPSATQVMITGRSAGGLGALMNHELTQRSFDCVRVDAFSDSGGPLPDMYLRPCLQDRVRGLWDLEPAIPDGCTECSCQMDGGGLVNVYPYLSARFPNSRFGFLSSVADGTMRGFYGYGYSPACNFPSGMPEADFEAGLNGIRTLTSGLANFRTFYLQGSEHTFTGRALSTVTSGGSDLGVWLDQMVNDSAMWSNVGP